jgi:hypothetical protein
MMLLEDGSHKFIVVRDADASGSSRVEPLTVTRGTPRCIGNDGEATRLGEGPVERTAHPNRDGFPRAYGAHELAQVHGDDVFRHAHCPARGERDEGCPTQRDLSVD